MSKITDIQWCDSTVNPIMGCGGCELFPSPKKVTDVIDVAIGDTGVNCHAAHNAQRATLAEFCTKTTNKHNK